MEPFESNLRLEEVLKVWPSDSFQDVFKQNIEQLDASILPLQQGLSQGSCVSNEPFKVMIISTSEETDSIRVKAGIFFKSIIAGCNCADDPTPADTLSEYCVVQFDINKTTAETGIQLIEES